MNTKNKNAYFIIIFYRKSVSNRELKLTFTVNRYKSSLKQYPFGI